MKFWMLSRASWLPRSVSARNLRETEMSASSGHGWNQSMTTQLTSAGKRRVRTLIGSPMGLMHMITCKLSRTELMKQSQQLSRVSGRPLRLTIGRTLLMMSSMSSAGKRPGMLPDESKSFMNTRKRSSAICWSVKMNEMPSPFTPAFLYMICRSALRSLTE